MARIFPLFLALLLVGGAARAADDHAGTEFSLSLGAGLAYELAGFNFAVRRGHFEGFLGAGLLTLIPGFSAGARWFLQPDVGGFFVGLNLGAHAWTGGLFDADGSTGGSAFWATVTPGYRWAWEQFFLQAAIGGGLVYNVTSWSTPPSPRRRLFPYPDAMLAAGIRF